MGAIDNLDANELRDIVRRLERVERAAPVGFSTVSRGALRITSDEGLIVEGSASVTGTLKGIGKLLWDGIVTLTSTFTAKGTTRFEGDTTQVGAHHVQGNQDITGTLAVNGAATLNNNLTVGSGGKITVGLVDINPSVGGYGGMSSATAIQFNAPNFYVSGGMAASGVITANGGLTVMLPIKVGATANLHVDAFGKVWQIG